MAVDGQRGQQTGRQAEKRELERGMRRGSLVLVFPAASSPSMSNLISFDPKILPMSFETWPPMVNVLSV